MHGRLHTNVFRDEARQKFVNLLEKAVGTKVGHMISFYNVSPDFSLIVKVASCRLRVSMGS